MFHYTIQRDSNTECLKALTKIFALLYFTPFLQLFQDLAPQFSQGKILPHQIPPTARSFSLLLTPSSLSKNFIR